jgi:hypothetical protein
VEKAQQEKRSAIIRATGEAQAALMVMNCSPTSLWTLSVDIVENSND